MQRLGPQAMRRGSAQEHGKQLRHDRVFTRRPATHPHYNKPHRIKQAGKSKGKRCLGVERQKLFAF
ncbi:MAG: hypothetical protein EBV16_10030 [Betaproteobacteria bacterium]|nr:hypothetical protein [Betaproteobacteria bacterium]